MFIMRFLFLLLTHCIASINAQGLAAPGALNPSGNSVEYTVLVNNDTTMPIDVYFFTQPAIFDGTTGQFSNSLGTQTVQPGTSQAKFRVQYSYYAAAQKFESPVGDIQSTSVALVPILPKIQGGPGYRTTMSFDKNLEPVLSSPPVAVASVAGSGFANTVVDGSFQITTPQYPAGQGIYGIGLGAISNGGEYQLASYTLARPGVTTNVQPVVTFFVAIGRTQKGKDANFFSVSSSAAVCDGTKGTNDFVVVRTSAGGWTVNGVPQ